jgi:hypothetical protein
LGQSFFSGFDRQIAGGNAFIDNMPFADTHALLDPLIVGIDHFFQVGVGQKAWRDVGTKGADFGADELSQ